MAESTPKKNAFDVLMRSASPASKRKAAEASPPAKRPTRAAPGVQQQQNGDAADPTPSGSQPTSDTADTDKAKAQQEARAAFMRALSQPARPAKQAFTHLLVIDLEATCNQQRTLRPIEIIELSCVIIDTSTAQSIGEFQTYVRPTEHPLLNDFTIDLTGISQDQVDAAPLLDQALQSFDAWLSSQGVPVASSAAACWTSWDLEVALSMECQWRGIKVQPYLCAWIDLKKAYIQHYKRAGNLRSCVESAGLKWEGRAHSGIDDAKNEARLAAHLMRRGVKFQITGAFPEDAPHRAASGQLPAAADGGTIGGTGGSNGMGVAGGGARQALLAPKRTSKAPAAATHDKQGRFLGVCKCGVKAASRVTKKPGVNHGRAFYSCGNWRMVAREGKEPCDFFLWVDDG